MKTKTKSTTKRNFEKTDLSSTKGNLHEDDRDLNVVDQYKLYTSIDLTTGFARTQEEPMDVEMEEDREKKRKVEEARGAKEN
jgi:hypothetical protein